MTDKNKNQFIAAGIAIIVSVLILLAIAAMAVAYGDPEFRDKLMHAPVNYNNPTKWQRSNT